MFSSKSVIHSSIVHHPSVRPLSTLHSSSLSLIHLFISPFIHLPIYSSTHHPFIHPSILSSIIPYPFIHPSIHSSIYPSIAHPSSREVPVFQWDLCPEQPCEERPVPQKPWLKACRREGVWGVSLGPMFTSGLGVSNPSGTKWCEACSPNTGRQTVSALRTHLLQSRELKQLTAPSCPDARNPGSMWALFCLAPIWLPDSRPSGVLALPSSAWNSLLLPPALCRVDSYSVC